MTLDSTYGIRVINHSATDNVAERVSVCYDSGSGATEQGRLVAYSNYVLLNAMLTTLRLVGGEVLIESDDTGNIFLEQHQLSSNSYHQEYVGLQQRSNLQVWFWCS